MPSSNIRDDLPAHYDRVAELRRIAARIIQNMGPMRRSSSFTPRTAQPANRRSPQEPRSATEDSRSKPAQASEPLQIEGSPGISAAELRHLLRDQI